MVIKWKAIIVEDRKLKDHLICYSEKAGQFALHCNVTALEEALKWLEKENCQRIIIEKEKIEI